MRRLLVVALACHPAVPAHHDASEPRGEQVLSGRGRVGVHGMVVFGHDRVFMSHIPMTHAPHDMQLVIEVDLPGGDGLRTFEPRPFSLDALRAGELTSFTGDLYRGNFEAGGEKLASDVRVTVKRVVYAAELVIDPGDGSDDYLVVGPPNDAYAVHLIRTTADVDRVVKVQGLPEGQIAHAPTPVEEVSCLVPPDYASACR